MASYQTSGEPILAGDRVMLGTGRVLWVVTDVTRTLVTLAASDRPHVRTSITTHELDRLHHVSRANRGGAK